MTQETYLKLLPHKAVITHIGEGGGATTMPQEIYDLAPEIGLSVDQSCNGCRLEYIKDLYNLMNEYEQSTKA